MLSPAILQSSEDYFYLITGLDITNEPGQSAIWASLLHGGQSTMRAVLVQARCAEQGAQGAQFRSQTQ